MSLPIQNTALWKLFQLIHNETGYSVVSVCHCMLYMTGAADIVRHEMSSIFEISGTVLSDNDAKPTYRSHNTN